MDLQRGRRARRTVLAEFDLAWKQYSRKIRSFALRILGDEDEAEDIVQKTFISFYTALLFESIDNSKIWLLRTAENHLRHYKRTVARRNKHEVSLEAALPLLLSAEAPPPTATREDFVGSLPKFLREKDKELLALYYFDQLELQEIAALSGYTYGGLRVHLSKLRDKLRMAESEILL